MRDSPHISVITIFFNAKEFIEEAIESVFAQTYDRWELLLVDDGSTDAGTQIARGYATQYPDRVRYLEHDGHTNQGMSASRNLGICKARGEFIAFLDADDVWLPRKLESQVALLESQPQAGMVYGPTQYWYSWTGLPEDLERDYVPDLGVPQDTLYEPPALLTILHPLGQATAPCLCSLLVRRQVIDAVGGFEESFRGSYEDQAFLTKVYLRHSVFVSGECWDRYRIHPASCSAMVNQEGHYDSFRGFFLKWFKKYLRKQSIGDPQVWKALNDALQPYQDSPYNGEPETRWLRLLRVAEGNIAQLVIPSDNPDSVRIDISKVTTRTSYDIQLNQPRLKAESKSRYIVNFLARADAPRTLFFGFAKGHAPWSNLGLYRQVALTPEWQSFEESFVVTEDEENARIHFDVGESDISVELSSVTVRSLTQGRFVKPILPSTRMNHLLGGRRQAEQAAQFGTVDFGSLRRTTPISLDFGCDRGLPIDRYYIENFLARYGEDVRGRTLEIGDNSYTRRYGGERVTRSDVLHVVEGSPQATIIADLSSAGSIPSNTFDCIILTQTLQLIFDVRAAVKTIYRILKPGGVLLATFPGISQTYDNEWGDTWYWNFTAVSARRLFEEVFPPEKLKIESFGNVLAAISFLHGIAVEELTQEELDYSEAGYDVTLTVRSVKPEAGNGIHRIDRTGDIDCLPETSSDRKALILMYHRVAEGCVDPWSLCVSPQHFSQHIEVLRKDCQPMGLQQLVGSLDSGNLLGRSVVVTFDDGYADNLYAAKPLLERYDIPATVFVTTGYIGENREFWWDELERLLLQPGTLPKTVWLRVKDCVHQWDLGEAAYYARDRWERDLSWRAPENPPSARHSVYADLWRLLQLLPERERAKAMQDLRVWASEKSEPRSTHRLLTQEEIVSLERGGLVDVGSHTRTHPVLSELSPQSQREEVGLSKVCLESILGRPITSLGYPFGAYAPETIRIVQEAGFSCACSTVETAVREGCDRFQLPRVEIKDWDGEEFSRRLRAWFAD